MPLIPAIAAPIAPAMRIAAKLLILLAVLLMPLGMSAAPAASAPHHGSGAALPHQHCPGEDGSADMTGGVPECAMACSAALPAAELGGEEPVRISFSHQPASGGDRLRGLHPDTATPPPKRW